MCFLHLELLLFLESTLVRHIAEGIPLVDVHKYIKGKKKKKYVAISICFYQALKIKQSILFTHERFYSESAYIWHGSYFSLIKNKYYNECLPFNCSILVSFCPQFRNMFSKNEALVKAYSACPIPMPSLSSLCFPSEE